MRKTIHAVFSGLALAAMISACLYASDIIVAPNPWAPESNKAALGTLAGGITFYNLPAEGTLRIYAVDGALVRRFEFSAGSGTINWDGKDTDGSIAASGVYIWILNAPGFRRSGKVIVVR